ncbi:MAG: hypothetical protein HY912_09380 [Desulfomonile tiedjei]|uniref:Uncharacterized protein n=1 Tax=Desulfomonile tiedjei TaxID=2358 RepID=A0A9D6V1B3_9BACT|nr:hypothetical protein [Desulfomonile tiedjei]
MGLKIVRGTRFDGRIPSEGRWSRLDAVFGTTFWSLVNRAANTLCRFVGRAGAFPGATIVILVSTALAGPVDYARAQWPLGKDLTQPETRTESSANVTGSGRFQIFVSPQAKGYTFMLDTETGRVWIMKKDHTSGEFSLQRVQVEQIDQPGAKTPPEKAEKTDKARGTEGNK